MKIKGTVTTIERLDVDVRPEDMFKALVRIAWERAGGHPGQYVNRRGYWETDHGGHGSGFQEQHRKATDVERELIRLLESMRDVTGLRVPVYAPGSEKK